MNPTLKVFYDNDVQREAVKEFMIECLKELAVERVLNRKDVASIADAKDVVEHTFTRLREIYGNAPKPVNSNSR
jgi:hypothetical protein